MKSLPWTATPEQFDRILRTMRFRYFKWDTHACGALKILPESLVLAPEEHAEVVTVGERLGAVLARLEDRVRADAGLIAALGIPREVVPLIQAERPTELQVARYDLFPTVEGGWAVSEFNEDVPGGFNEAIAAPDLLADVHPGHALPGSFRDEFLNAVPPDGTVALMYATAYSEDLQHMLVLESLLNARGQETVLCAPSHLGLKRGRPAINGRTVGSAVRFYPGEWFPLLPNLAAWQRLAPTLPMMNPLGRLIRQSKRLFALWNLPGLLDADDRQFMDRLAPATEFFDPARVPALRRERPEWVLKRAFGRMGDTVVMGRLVNDEEWDRALREAEREPEQYIIQRCFDVSPLRLSSGMCYPAVGVFLINGRFAGYYSRVAPLPFLTHEATYVATVVEAA